MAHIKSHENRLGTIIVVLLVLAVFAGLPKAGEAHTKKILHSFIYGKGAGDGNDPAAGLVSDSAGVLYGTTQGGGAFFQGAVFAVTPPTVSGGAWSEKIIYSFTGGADGAAPVAPVTLGKNGVLYGTTSAGGMGGGIGCPTDCGVVFQLTPPATAGGAWTESVIYSFRGGADGDQPFGGVSVGKDGTLYGTTGAVPGYVSDTVFALTPPSKLGGSWAEKVLYVFAGKIGSMPRGQLLVGKDGTLYGTTSNEVGAAYSLTPPQAEGGAWTETTLHTFLSFIDDGFAPLAGVVAGKNGLLYGTTSQGGVGNGGVVYALTPPASTGGSWTESIIHSFTGVDGVMPAGEVVLTGNGSILGTTAGASYAYGFGQNLDGTLYALAPPATAGSSWSATVLPFKGSPDDGAIPLGSLLIGKGGVLYGTTSAGGTYGSGTVFEITP